jgi:signal transduction histidine kinase
VDVLLVLAPVLVTCTLSAVVALALEVDPLGAAPIALLAVAATAAPLLWARAAPLSAVAALSAVSCAATGLTRRLTESLPLDLDLDDGAVTSVLVLVLALGTASLCAVVPAVYQVARRRGRRPLVAAVVLYSVPTTLTTAVLDGTAPLPALGLAVLGTLLTGLFLAPVWLVGLQHHARAERAAERARRQAEFAERAVRDERTRIMRELQDLVLADLASIEERAERTHRALASGAAASRDDVEQALVAISGSGRDALGAMRRLLGLLRGTGEGAMRSPQPTLDGLDDLVESFRGAGLDVDVDVSGDRRPLPAEVDLAAYRLLQRVLAGSGRDGPVHLRVAYADRGLRLCADGDIGDVGGATVREWVRLVGGEMRTPGPRAIDVWLPAPATASA